MEVISCNPLIIRISLEYLKLYICVQIFLLDRNTWYKIVCKILLKNKYSKNANLNVEWRPFSNL